MYCAAIEGMHVAQRISLMLRPSMSYGRSSIRVLLVTTPLIAHNLCEAIMAFPRGETETN